MCFHIFQWFSKCTLKGVCLSVQKQLSEAFYKKVFLKISQNSQENICARDSFTVLGKIFGARWGSSSGKLDKARKVWYLLLRVFWLLRSEFNFWGGDWALGYVSAYIWDVPNIFLFPKILSLELFENPWGNSYSKFAILNITFRFTCG